MKRGSYFALSLSCLIFCLGIFARGQEFNFSATANAQESSDLAADYTDIAYIYHGVALDRQLRPITLNRETVDAILNSMVKTLSTPKKAIELPDGQMRPLVPAPLNMEAFTGQTKQFSESDGDPLFVKLAIIQAAARKLPPDQSGYILERAALLRQALGTMPNLKKPKSGSALSKSLLAFDNKAVAVDPSKYIADCEAAGVPIPPNWPNSAWIDRGALPSKFSFASFPGTVASEVFTYQPADGTGICYALPRTDGAGSIGAMGVICQSRQTGRACFFDNLDTNGDRITGTAITMDFATVQNGYSLQENCTGCHRGANAFMIHPKTPLGSASPRDAITRYSPIGQSTWINPPPMAPEGSGDCAECHEIAAASPGYCRILRQAADKTMPSPNAVAGWVNPTDDYKAHIAFLKTQCP